MKCRSFAWFPRAVLVLAAMAAFGVSPVHSQGERAAGGSGLSGEPTRWSGWVQFDTAYDWPDPSHWANARTRGELAGRGAWGNGVKWKVSARAYYDAAYDASSLLSAGGP